MIVVCKNMSASDIEKLVPNISKACQFSTDGKANGAGGKDLGKKHCMELTKKNVLGKGGTSALSVPVPSPLASLGQCKGEECKQCRKGDFACLLRLKVSA